MGPWLALVLLDAITVATFARCFNGPGELAVIVPVCIGAHLVAHFARGVSAKGKRLESIGIWALALFLVVLVPVVIVDGATFSWLLPLGATQHALSQQMHAGWHIFSFDVAPVAQAHGLVLAAAWAAGALALAAEALDGDTTLPAIVALVPAFDIVVFTGTLGTATGRGFELAALAGLGVWYLAGSTRRAATEQVVIARIEGTTAPLPLADSGTKSRWALASWRAGTPVPGLVVVAALAAGVLGPLLPGAQSTAAIPWHSTGGSNSNKGGGHAQTSGPVRVNDLVEMTQSEINNAHEVLFRVYGASPTREVLALLDRFNGDQWYPINKGDFRRLPEFTSSIADLEAHPEKETVFKNGGIVTQVVQNINLAGSSLPVPGPVLATNGIGPTTMRGTDGPVDALSPLASNSTYAVRAVLPPPADVAEEFVGSGPGSLGPGYDLELPQPVPLEIVNLALGIVGNDHTELGKATDIVNYLTSSLFKYQLPTTVPTDKNIGYSELQNFLFSERTGYCQQFAGAFAVLAREVGLPTRIAVGFLPGRQSKGSWIVTGSDVHAWPQVYFPGTGWIDFEPTPGTPAAPTANVTTTTLPTATTTPKTGTTSPIHCRSCQPPVTTGSGITFPTAPPPGAATNPSHHGSNTPLYVLMSIVAAALLWALAVPSLRYARWRHHREPARAVLLAWQEAVVALAAAGLHRRRAETFGEFALRLRLAGLLSDEAISAFDGLVAAVNGVHFGRRPPNAQQGQEALVLSRVVRKSARHAMSWWVQLLLQLDPRDLARA
jgi:transglutaminase-like putative cysteine protease